MEKNKQEKTSSEIITDHVKDNIKIFLNQQLKNLKEMDANMELAENIIYLCETCPLIHLNKEYQEALKMINIIKDRRPNTTEMQKIIQTKLQNLK